MALDLSALKHLPTTGSGAFLLGFGLALSMGLVTPEQIRGFLDLATPDNVTKVVGVIIAFGGTGLIAAKKKEQPPVPPTDQGGPST